MYRSIRGRLRSHERRNQISICLLIILLICIYSRIKLNKKLFSKKKMSLNLMGVARCPQLSSSSSEYLHVDFVENVGINYSSMCKESDQLLVYILSSAINVENRQLIRQTWARKRSYSQLNKSCFIFIVGIPLKGPFLPSVDIPSESLRYGDIVQLNVNETYENVVYKEIGALKWSFYFASKIVFLFKTDDDLVLDSILLADIVQYLLSNRTNHSRYFQQSQSMQHFIQEMSMVNKYTFFKGKDMGGIQTLRSGKFQIHQLAWNDNKLPPYCSGFGFLYSSFIRDRLYRASLCYRTEYVPLVGDVFISGFLAGAASVRCSGWSLTIFQAGDNCPQLFEELPHLLVCSTPLHRKRRIYSAFDPSWRIILRRHHILTNQTSI